MIIKLEKSFLALEWKFFNVWNKIRPCWSYIPKRKWQKCDVSLYPPWCLFQTLLIVYIFCLAQTQCQNASEHSYTCIQTNCLKVTDEIKLILYLCARSLIESLGHRKRSRTTCLILDWAQGSNVTASFFHQTGAGVVHPSLWVKSDSTVFVWKSTRKNDHTHLFMCYAWLLSLLWIT